MWGRRVSPGRPLGPHLAAFDREHQNGSLLSPGSMTGWADCAIEGDAAGVSRSSLASSAPHLYWISLSLCSGSCVQGHLINGAVEFLLPLY